MIAPLPNFLEALAFPTFVALYIWRCQEASPKSWLLFPVWLALSFVLHRDTPKTLGWRADNFWKATRRSAVVFVPFIIGLCFLGLVLGGLHRPFNRHFFGYMAFCLLQQVGLSSYVTNRLFAATDNAVRASLIAGTIFAALHWPNPVLVPLTCVGGIAMSWLFVRERNILPLALGQSILGTLVWWAIPVAWHHAMRVGPGFYHFHPR